MVIAKTIMQMIIAMLLMMMQMIVFEIRNIIKLSDANGSDIDNHDDDKGDDILKRGGTINVTSNKHYFKIITVFFSLKNSSVFSINSFFLSKIKLKKKKIEKIPQ